MRPSAEFVWVAAMLVTLVVAIWSAERAGLDQRATFVAASFGLVGALVGGSVWAAAFGTGVTTFSLSNLLGAEKAVMGAFAGAAIGGGLFLRARALPVLRYAEDALAAVFLGYAVARVGCLVNGCCFGVPTDLSWGLRYPPGTEAYLAQVERGLIASGAEVSLPVHPTQLYHAAIGILGAGLMVWLRGAAPGVRFALALAVYGVSRVAVEFLRGDARAIFGPFDADQLVALTMVLCAAALWTGHGHRLPTPAR